MVTWGGFYIFLFAYRSVFSVLGQVVVLAFTSFLGDSKQYQNRGITLSDGWYLDSNLITENIGGAFSTVFLGNALLINMGFQAIGFYGIYRLLESVDPVLRRRLAVLALFPSFTLWTSVAGKEAILTFALGIIGSYIAEMYYGRARLRPLHLLATLVVFIFKAHYGAALLFFFGATYLASFVQQKAFVVIVLGLVSLVPLFIFREEISALSFEVIPHFLGFGNSSRDAFWIDKYDVFFKAPEGMFVGFFGPTIGEALRGNPLQLISFIESAALVALLLFYLVKRLPRLPAYNLFLSVFTMFWILFPNYPFGIMNPGSAVRYRSGYLIFLFLVVVILSSRRVHAEWLSHKRLRS